MLSASDLIRASTEITGPLWFIGLGIWVHAGATIMNFVGKK